MSIPKKGKRHLTQPIDPAAEQEILEQKKEEAVAELDSRSPEVEPRVQTQADPPKPKRKRKISQQKDVITFPLDFEGCAPPEHLWMARRIGLKEYKPKHAKEVLKGVMHLPGRGSKEAKVMFVSPCVLMEELSDTNISKPMQLKGPQGALFMRNLKRMGFKDEDWFHTALVKYNVPKLKPKPADVRWGTPAFVDELKVIKPKIVVCLGKAAFDWFMNRQAALDGTKAYSFKLHDIQGAWFDSREFDCRIYPMDTLGLPIWKPEYLERFMVDLAQVQEEQEEIEGGVRVRITQDYHTLTKATELANCFYEDVVQAGVEEVAVDCEWHGQTAYSGRLRSFQFSWAPGKAAYVRLMDDKLNYAFDKPLQMVRSIMGGMTQYRTADPLTGQDRWKIRFIGHNAAADMPWLDHHVGIDMYKRIAFDTMFAQHTINEYADLKLERMAVKFTDLGRYDLDLLMWKKSHGFDEEDNEGYGKVPDSIIIPYACLRGDSLVQLGDGSWRPIRQLVKERYSGTVKAFLHNEVQNCRVTNWYRNDVRQKEWYQIQTVSTKGCRWGSMGPVFTPDHKVITQRGKVRVDELRCGVDQILTEEREFTPAQLSVVLGCLLGDGGFVRKNHSGIGLRFSQRPATGAYADWKAEMFWSHQPVCRPRTDGYHSYELPFGRYLHHLSLCFPTKELAQHGRRKLIITRQVLDVLGDLGLAVWYQDDGTLAKDKRCNHMSSRIYCCIGDEEQGVVLDWLSKKFGDGISYNSRNHFVQITGDAFMTFHMTLRPFMHPVMGYKTPIQAAGPFVDRQLGKPFLETITAVVPRPNSSTRRGDGVRYCLSVENAENFLTKVGFVSNCRDVDATLRIAPELRDGLAGYKLTKYYFARILPFVTDGFYEMMDCGLPINIEYLNEMRDVFTVNQAVLIHEFRMAVSQDADRILLKVMKDMDPERAEEAFPEIRGLIDSAWKPEAGVMDLDHPAISRAREDFKNFMGQKHLEKALPVFEHRVNSPMFNINSVDHLKRWMFDAMGLRPIKTTKRDGIQISWDKVEAMEDATKRAEYEPAADKQTIKVYAEQFPLIAQLQELKAVSTIVKTFLRGVDPETKKEQGLHKWVQEDGRIHANFALTETARPRAWKPNILNWPKAVTRPIEAAFKRVNKILCHGKYFELKAQGISPLEIKRQVMEIRKKPTVLRANVQAPEGWVMIDMDLKTAEIVALFFQAKDINGMKVLTDPDTQFARISEKDKKKVVRIAFNEISQYPESEWDPKLIVSKDDPRILRREDGSIIHPGRDLHWELGEIVMGKPREKCDERMVRDGCGKVGNFSIPYGASASLLERLIEANTGKKPEPGTGQKMIDMWCQRYEQAADFLIGMENIVHSPGWWPSLSGRMRHFYLNKVHKVEDHKNKNYSGIFSSLSRQARNFPMQELVAATTAEALDTFIRRRREMKLQARIGLLLYDAITAFCPLSEVKATTKLLQECLTGIKWPKDRNNRDNGETFNFDVDITYAFRWGLKMTPKEKEFLQPYLE